MSFGRPAWAPSAVAGLAGLALSVGACAHGETSFRVGDAQVTTLRVDYSNVHLVEVQGSRVLVDAALQRDAHEVIDQLAARGVGDLDAIVVTHGHADHAGGACGISEWADAPVIVGAGDLAMVTTGQNTDTLCPTDGIGRRRLPAAQARRFSPLTPDHTLAEEESLALADMLSANVPGVLTSVPGHTEGSIVWVVGRAVFVGDVLRGSITGNAARVHHFQCDLEDNASDIRALLTDIAPDGQTFFTGHFGPVSRVDVLELLDVLEDRVSVTR